MVWASAAFAAHTDVAVSSLLRTRVLDNENPSLKNNGRSATELLHLLFCISLYLTMDAPIGHSLVTLKDSMALSEAVQRRSLIKNRQVVKGIIIWPSCLLFLAYSV